MSVIQDQTLSPAQVILLTKAMLSVALIDGLAPAEAALIGQFYENSRNASMPGTTELLARPDARQFDVAELAGCEPELADTVVLMCLMTGYADGRLSDAERAQVQAIASELNVSDERFDELLAQVRDELIGALSHLPDAGSVAAVVKELAAAD
jgi:tellurite resistance protein